MVCAFCVVFRKSFHTQRSQIFSPTFSSRSFIVLTLTFRPLIHFELFFCVGYKGLMIIFFHREIQLVLHHFWKRLSFPHRITLTLLLKISCLYVWICMCGGLFLDYFVSSIYMSVLLPVHNFMVLQASQSSHFVVLLKTVLKGPFWVSCISIHILELPCQFLQQK